MAQALLLVGGANASAGAATSCRCAVHPVCTPLQQQGNVSIVSVSALSRSKLIAEGQLPYKCGNVLRSRGNSTRKSRLLATAELQEAVSTAEQQLSGSSSSAISTFPIGSKLQLNVAASSSYENGGIGPAPNSVAQESVTKTITDVQDAVNDSIGSTGKAFTDVFENINGSIKGSVNSVTGFYGKTVDDIKTSIDRTVTKAGGLKDAASSSPGAAGTGPALNAPEPNSGSVLPDVDPAITQIPPVESAGVGGPDVLKAAEGSVGNPEELTPLQRFEALINRANGGGNARKPVASDSITAAQESVTKTITDVQDAVNDSIGSAGKAITDVYEDINGSIKGSVNSVTGFYGKTVDDIKTSIDSTVLKAEGLKDTASSSPGNAGTGPALNTPEPNSGSVLPDVDAAVTQTPPVESAGVGGPDVLKAAEGSVGNPEELTPLQRYEALINRANGGGGARKPVTSDEDITSFSFPDSITSAQESMTKTITDVQDAINDSIGSASKAITDTFGSVGKAITDVYEDINGSIKGSVNSVTGFYGKTVDDIQTSVDSTVTKAGGEVADFTSVFRSGTPLNNQLKEVVVVVKGATGAALEASGNVLTDIYGSTRVILPPEVQSSLSVAEQKVQEISQPLGSFLQQAYGALEDVERALGVDPDNPIFPVFLVVGGTLYLGVSLWQARYGGYSGDLMPVSAFDLLKKESNVVLVDIRPQELRESEGIPDLRRGTRTRFATVEAMKVDGSLRSRLKNAKEIDSILTASVIRNLKTVKPGTKVIVMDNDGSQSKEIARALRRFGVRRRYRVDGGYKSWTAAGLRTKLEGTDTPISILQEDAAEIVEEVKPTPGLVVLVALGTVAGIYAAYEWEKTLQLLGVIGIGQAVFNRFKSYDSVEDVKADLRLLQKPFRAVGNGILWILGQVEPGTLQLATTPSTSAVQDRVVQAAAKHGPLASELAEDDESGSEVDVESSPESSPPLSTEEGGPGNSSPPTASE